MALEFSKKPENSLQFNAAKSFSFVFVTACFFIVLGGMLFLPHFWGKNLLLLGLILTGLLCVNFVLPFLLEKINLAETASGIRKGAKNFAEILNMAIVGFCLFFVYLFVVGMTKLIAVLVGKKFLKLGKSMKSFWQLKKLNQSEESLKKLF